MKRENHSSNTIWEETIGYSRLVRVGNQIYLSGTTATNGSEIIGINNPYEQTKYIIEKIQTSLQEAGSKLSDIVRVRIFIVNIMDWDLITSAYTEYFKYIKPAATMLVVNQLINKDLLLEIEADAVLTD